MNRNGLAVGAMVTSANGTVERKGALEMMDTHAPPAGATLGADKGYDAWRFRQALRDRSITRLVWIWNTASPWCYSHGWVFMKWMKFPAQATQNCSIMVRLKSSPHTITATRQSSPLNQ